jgi:hypothetical protein
MVEIHADQFSTSGSSTSSEKTAAESVFLSPSPATPMLQDVVLLLEVDKSAPSKNLLPLVKTPHSPDPKFPDQLTQKGRALFTLATACATKQNLPIAKKRGRPPLSSPKQQPVNDAMLPQLNFF